MSLRFIIIVITVVVCVNIYYDNLILKNFKIYKKYYQIAFILLCGIGFFNVLQKNPNNGIQSVKTMQQFINVLPVDRQAKNYLNPLFDYANPEVREKEKQSRSINILNSSGGNKSKRSVSETKKKYIASNQNWKCNKCNDQLTAWFEVDHIKRLEYGGTNEVSNLEALCRNCHGKKTAMENMK